MTGPYLLMLGASAFVVAGVSGLGEFLGYGVRLLSGYFSDKTRNYWFFTVAGYLMIGAIPLLVFAGSWQVAAILLIVERIGKGIRSPARDTILSHVSKDIGRGRGFGLHEALDQIGAVLGPLIFTVAYYAYGGFKEGFALMVIPFFLMIIALIIARAKAPVPERFEKGERNVVPSREFPRIMLPYSLFIFFVMAGFLVYPLMAYHFAQYSIVPEGQIPLLYAIAMGVDAVVALLVGMAYDRKGMVVLGILPVLAIFIPVLSFSQNYACVILATVLWGASLGMQETVLRAAVADYTHIEKRGTAYGILNMVYGGAWFVGGLVTGFLYEFSLPWLVIFSVVMQIAGLATFRHLCKIMK
ncbi:MFS transporter [uncultured Methanoregula sp.]|uniref:MFS transporter n=1 Tax=uncultured Methanoregula sp. TaxID=1005933 RepID=UPI003749A2FC